MVSVPLVFSNVQIRLSPSVPQLPETTVVAATAFPEMAKTAQTIRTAVKSHLLQMQILFTALPPLLFSKQYHIFDIILLLHGSVYWVSIIDLIIMSLGIFLGTTLPGNDRNSGKGRNTAALASFTGFRLAPSVT